MTADRPPRVARAGEIVVIQQLRGIAALLVVFHHALGKVPWIFNPFEKQPGFGQGGVDIFFVISGCVMYVAARHERPGEFAFKRLLRIVPLYWLMTLVFVMMRHAHWGSAGMNPVTLFKSLLFLPYTAPSGQIWPILVPGWSLNVEMFFYLLFGIGLALRRPAIAAGALVTLCVVAGLILHPRTAAPALYTSPILIEFVVGLALGHLLTVGHFPHWMWPALPLGAIVLFGSDLAAPYQALARGIGGVLVMTGALALEAKGAVPRVRALKTLGDASYALYLVHTPMLLVLWTVFAHLPLHGWLQFSLFFAIALVGAIVFAILMHHLVEKPLLRLVKHRGRGGIPVLAEPGAAPSTAGAAISSPP